MLAGDVIRPLAHVDEPDHLLQRILAVRRLVTDVRAQGRPNVMRFRAPRPSSQTLERPVDLLVDVQVLAHHMSEVYLAG